jgi:outer membrane protein assembly factor BamB
MNMKASRFLLLLVIMAAVLGLTACGGAAPTTWPGVTVTQDTAYISYVTDVFAVRLSDGSLAWRYPEKPDTAKLFYAPPVVSDDMVVVGDFEKVLFGLDKQTGKEKWSFTQGQSKYIGGGVKAGDLYLVPSADHNLYALDANGALKWQFTAKQALWAAPAVNEKMAFVSSMDHSLYAVDLSTGKMVWSLDLTSPMTSPPALSKDGKTIYQGTLSNGLVAVDANGGTQIWNTKTDGGLWTAPVVIENSLYVGDASGKIYAMSAKDGAVIWKTDAGSPITGAPAVFSKGLAFGTDKGEVVTVSLEGAKGWTKVLTGKLHSGVFAVGEKLYVPSFQGEKLLYVLDTNGNDVWSFVAPK